MQVHIKLAISNVAHTADTPAFKAGLLLYSQAREYKFLPQIYPVEFIFQGNSFGQLSNHITNIKCLLAETIELGMHCSCLLSNGVIKKYSRIFEQSYFVDLMSGSDCTDLAKAIKAKKAQIDELTHRIEDATDASEAATATLITAKAAEKAATQVYAYWQSAQDAADAAVVAATAAETAEDAEAVILDSAAAAELGMNPVADAAAVAATTEAAAATVTLADAADAAATAAATATAKAGVLTAATLAQAAAAASVAAAAAALAAYAQKKGDRQAELAALIAEQKEDCKNPPSTTSTLSASASNSLSLVAEGASNNVYGRFAEDDVVTGEASTIAIGDEALGQENIWSSFNEGEQVFKREWGEYFITFKGGAGSETHLYTSDVSYVEVSNNKENKISNYKGFKKAGNKAFVRGTNKRDIIYGHEGVDNAWGGEGNDLFMLLEGDGYMTIRDYDPNKDSMRIDGEGKLGNVDGVDIIDDGGGDSMIYLGSDLLAIVEGVTPKDLNINQSHNWLYDWLYDHDHQFFDL